jgi:uncharacterized SAM-binding protein YcdF (DUF218 family)
MVGSGNREMMWRRILAAAMRLGAIGLLVVACRVPLLKGLAAWWIVDEVPAAADAIVVLGGGEDYRPFAAARLWKRGLAPVILVPEVKRSPTEELGLRPATTEVILGVLRVEGVPDSAVVRIGKDVTSTREEALAVKVWAAGERKAVPRLLIPTGPFETRRTNWLFEQTMPGGEAIVIRTDPRNLNVDVWWTMETGLIAFQNEFIKYLMCRVKYRR